MILPNLPGITRVSAIMKATKYRNAPGDALTSRGLTSKGKAPMCEQCIPHTSEYATLFPSELEI